MSKLNMMAAILKFINGRNRTREDIEDIINYITDPAKTEDGHLVSTLGCSHSDPLRDIENNKMAWHKLIGNQHEHFVMSFPTYGHPRPPAEVLRTAEEIVATVYSEYMAVIAVHTDSRFLHAHVVLDSVNAITGKKFSQGPKDLNRVKQQFNAILHANGFEIIRMSANDLVDHTDYSKVTGFEFLELDETKLITESDMQAVSIDAELISEANNYDDWSECAMLTPIPNFYGGIVPMNTSNNYALEAQQPQETPAPLLVEQAVPTAAVPSRYPTTTVSTGPVFRIKGTSHSDFTGLNELVTQTTEFAQEHQLEAANLALAMQVKAQEIGYPTNVSVMAGPIFDIDLCGGDNSPQLLYGDDGEKYD